MKYYDYASSTPHRRGGPPRKKSFQSGSRGKHKASEGMTAAIILIAFIITASGVAFVVLTLGGQMQLELDTVGDDGKDAASSQLQVEGGTISIYGESSKVLAFAFNIKLVLSSGKVGLSSDMMVISVIIGNNSESVLSLTGTGDRFTTLTEAKDGSTSQTYDIYWYDSNNAGNDRSGDETLTGGEMARFYICMNAAADQAEAYDKVYIFISTTTALLKIAKVIPVSFSDGVTMFR